MPKSCLILTLAFFASVAQAQEFPSDVVVKFGGKTSPIHLSNCDDWRTKLAAGPTNSKWVYAYRSDVPDKDEYETTEHYLQRIKRPPAYASISLDVSFYDATYDADARTLTIDYDGHGGLVFLHKLSLGTYVGSNAFGVSRRVTKTKQVGLTATFEANSLFEPSHLVLAVSPARAKSIKENGQIRVLGEIVKSEWGPINFSSDPTLDDPSEEQMEMRDVTLAPLCAAVEVNGEVMQWSELQ